MSVLGGAFALMVLVTGTEEQLARLEEDVRTLGKDLRLTVESKRTDAARVPAEERGQGVVCRIRAVSMDHPGIVHKLTRFLAEEGVNVQSLDTTVNPAPTTGTPMFSLVLDAEVPSSVDLADFRGRLLRLGEEESIDLEFEAGD